VWRRAWRRVMRDGLWFVDIPRTSSSSIRTELAHHFGSHYGKADLLQSEHNFKSQVIPSHLTARAVEEYIGSKRWQQLFSFSIVRNPWARLKSMYDYRQLQNQLPSDLSFKQYLNLFFSDPNHPASPYNYHGHYYQCVDYLLDSKGKLMVTEVIKYEHRQVLQQISSQYPGLALGLLNLNSASVQNEYQVYYDNEDRELVKRWAQKDIAYFGYSFD